jgi:hypothetical protein
VLLVFYVYTVYACDCDCGTYNVTTGGIGGQIECRNLTKPRVRWTQWCCRVPSHAIGIHHCTFCINSVLKISLFVVPKREFWPDSADLYLMEYFIRYDNTTTFIFTFEQMITECEPQTDISLPVPPPHLSPHSA